MAKVKTQKLEDLKKMNAKDLSAELAKTEAELAHVTLQVKLGQDKQSHKIVLLGKQIARIKTLQTHLSKNEK